MYIRLKLQLSTFICALRNSKIHHIMTLSVYKDILQFLLTENKLFVNFIIFEMREGGKKISQFNYKLKII